MRTLLQSIQTYLNRVATYSPLVVLIELVLIGVVVWWVMRFLKGTRGARLIKGVALLVVTVYVVILMLPQSMGWQRIQFLYGNFLLFTFGAVVVAFQPELRRAFIQIGQTRLFSDRHSEVEHIIDALVDSAMYLSRNKIGAIIALERTVGLGTFIETGTVIDAKVSAGLLNTIFYSGSALHDMGVIIRNGRIAAAGCQFPLAESEEVDPTMGSRHRAALGLSKEGDTAVLVVSEETGRISLAYQGQLMVGLEPSGLRDTLLSLLAGEGLRKRRHKSIKAGELSS